MKSPAKVKRRILVVDDEPMVCEAVEMMLTFDGHSVKTATSGAEALAYEARHQALYEAVLQMELHDILRLRLAFAKPWRFEDKAAYRSGSPPLRAVFRAGGAAGT